MIIKRDREAIRSYFEDSSNLKGGWADEVAIPESAEDISSFLQDASRRKIPVTISGGGTGTTGARVPMGGAVISLERLNKIVAISKDSSSGGVGRVEAGVLVDNFKDRAEAEGLFYTCHPTERTATIGGTIATNASGSRSFRHGPTRKFVRALKFVLATGEMVHLKRGDKFISKKDAVLTLAKAREITIPMPSYEMPSVKNSAGYYAKDGMDLIDLFIGQEGTLAVVVEAELLLAGRPEEIFSCFAFFLSEEDSWNFAREAKWLEPLSIEYFDHNALEMIRELNLRIPPKAKAAIFFEKDVSAKDDEEAIEAWRVLLRRYDVREEDAWAEMAEGEAERFIEMRHFIPSVVNEKIRKSGLQKISTDIAVPDEKFLEMMNFYLESFKKEPLEHVIFGHIGESHVHVNILPRSDEERLKAKSLADQFVRKAVAFGGTVSAEHGIGKIKHPYLEALYGKRGILDMARIKKALDPSWILGLDNIFSKEIVKEI